MTSEHTEQAAVFEWASLMSNRYPELEMLHANPNQAVYNRAARYRNEGMRTGLLDMFLPVIIKDWFDKVWPGLFIEMKVGRNKPTENQNWWIDKLREQGYRVEVCYSADEAISVIKDYLGIGE